MDCPRPELLGRFVDDQLDEAARVAIEDHLDDCDDCRPLVAMLAKTASQRGEGESITQPDPLAVTAAAGTAVATLEGHADTVVDRRTARPSLAGWLAPGTEL